LEEAKAMTDDKNTSPVSNMSGEKLGRFDHHPDPAIDFCLAVDALDGHLFDARHGIGKPGEPARQIDDIFLARIRRAMEFRVGGDGNAVAAKQTLREIEASLKGSPVSSSGGRRYAPITDEQINDIVNCGDLSTARIKITRLIHNESGEPERFRRMVERRDEFIIANGLWGAFNEASRED
jgi:hypothetical protein